jgi:hypothetical protein
MKDILYLMLMLMTFLLIKTYYDRERFTPAEEIAITKKITELDNDYAALTKTIADQQKTMKVAGDQAAAAKASISAAKT